MRSPEWSATTLGHLLSLEYGCGLPTNVRTDTGFPVYGSSGEVGRHARPLVLGPGIVVGRKGTIGSVIWSAEPFWPIDTTYYVVTRDEVDLRWLYWRLEALDLARLDSSTGVPGLNRHDAYELAIRVPSSPEQRRIAGILDTIDDAIRKTERTLAKLRQMKQGLLHDLLTRGIDDNGELRDPERNPEQFKDTPLGPLPVDWRVRAVGSLGTIHTGTTPNTSAPKFYGGDQLFVSPGDIDEGARWVESTAKMLTDTGLRAARALPSSAVMVTSIGILGRVGRCKCRAATNQQINSIVPNDEVDPAFLYYAAGLLRPQMLQVAGLQVIPIVNKSRFSALFLPLPSLQEQRSLVQALDAHESRVESERSELGKLRCVKRGLSEDLLTGRVRVPVADATAA